MSVILNIADIKSAISKSVEKPILSAVEKNLQAFLQEHLNLTEDEAKGRVKMFIEGYLNPKKPQGRSAYMYFSTELIKKKDGESVTEKSKRVKEEWAKLSDEEMQEIEQQCAEFNASNGKSKKDVEEWKAVQDARREKVKAQNKAASDARKASKPEITYPEEVKYVRHNKIGSVMIKGTQLVVKDNKAGCKTVIRKLNAAENLVKKVSKADREWCGKFDLTIDTDFELPNDKKQKAKTAEVDLTFNETNVKQWCGRTKPNLTLAELKEHAESLGIDVKGLKTKADYFKAFMAKLNPPEEIEEAENEAEEDPEDEEDEEELEEDPEDEEDNITEDTLKVWCGTGKGSKTIAQLRQEAECRELECEGFKTKKEFLNLFLSFLEEE